MAWSDFWTLIAQVGLSILLLGPPLVILSFAFSSAVSDGRKAGSKIARQNTQNTANKVGR